MSVIDISDPKEAGEAPDLQIRLDAVDPVDVVARAFELDLDTGGALLYRHSHWLRCGLSEMAIETVAGAKARPQGLGAKKRGLSRIAVNTGGGKRQEMNYKLEFLCSLA